MKRFYRSLIREHLEKYRQMAFLVGPRQVGKTTIAESFEREFADYFYFNWDNQTDRQLIISGPEGVATKAKIPEIKGGKTLVVFDELHKYRKWKQFLKGFFDSYGKRCHVIVTGSAKLNVFQSSGDSLMGRYFLYRIHPLSVAELLGRERGDGEILPPKKLNQSEFEQLFTFGGFPEPFLDHTSKFRAKWQRLRQQQLIQEDIRNLSQIQEIAQLEMLAKVLRDYAGQLINYNTLASIINVSAPTVRRWLQCLEAFYYCFSIKPWTNNIKRSIRKEPKYFLWDWALVQNEGGRVENFVASHLLKAVQFWNDDGLGEYGLYFIRDKEKREVDFLVTKNDKPWFLVEAKTSGNSGISKSLYYYQKQLGVAHAFQAVFDMEYVDEDCFGHEEPIIVPMSTLFSQLV